MKNSTKSAKKMGYRNYVSVYCEGKKVVKNYDYEFVEHPFKNIPYGLHFQDNSFENKTITVKIHSCENKIFYVYSNKCFSEIKFQVKTWEGEIDDDQLFVFKAKEDLKISFLEYQYSVEDYFDYFFEFKCFTINLKDNMVDKKSFEKIEFTDILQEWVYIIDDAKIMQRPKCKN